MCSCAPTAPDARTAELRDLGLDALGDHRLRPSRVPRAGWRCGRQFDQGTHLGDGCLDENRLRRTRPRVRALVRHRGGPRLERLRDNDKAQAFLTGAGAAAIGVIAGSTVPPAWSPHEPWQFVLLGVAALWLLVLRRGVVTALVACGVIGALIGLF
nr:hypothetical protein [uncultured bacterium]